MQLRKLAAAMLVLGVSAGLAHAEDAKPAADAAQQQSTLDKIANNGVIVVGHRESSVPFSYYDNQQKVVGYSQDYSNAIVDAIKKKLNNPKLDVKLIPITSQNRIPLLQNGTFDFECGSTTNNLERQKQAAFSDTIFVVGTRLLVKKGGAIKDFADLKDKAVVVTSGTTSEILLHKLNDEQKMNMRIISAKDHGDSFRTLESGRAVAFMMDEALLAGERAKAKKPDNWEIVGKPQSQEAYGCMLRKNDPDFKKLMDDTIAQDYKSGGRSPPGLNTAKRCSTIFEGSRSPATLFFLEYIYVHRLELGYLFTTGPIRQHHLSRLALERFPGHRGALYYRLDYRLPRWLAVWHPAHRTQPFFSGAWHLLR